MQPDSSKGGCLPPPEQLFNERIREAEAAPLLLDLVQTTNTSNAWRGDIGGQTYVVKEQTLNEMVGEAVGCLLGRAMGLNVPLGLTWSDGGLDYWLSPEVPAAMHWTSSQLPFLANKEHLGGMLVLDAIIGNWDRHSRNVLLQHRSDGTVVPWFIDHADSLAGHFEDLQSAGLNLPEKMLVPEDFPHDGLASSAGKYASDVAASRWRIESAVSAALESVPSLRDDERAKIREGVLARSADAVQLTTAYLSKIRSS